MVDAAKTPLTPVPSPPEAGGEGRIRSAPPSRFGKGAGGLGLRSYALGAIILFQLIYLPAANFIKLVALRLPESTGELDDDIQLHGQQFPDRVQAVADGLGTAFVRYGELTGQAQGWSLFAPIFGHQASLPMITVNDRAPTGTPIYASKDSEFAREQSFVSFRFPVTNCRLFNYEYRLALLYWGWDAQTYQSQRADWDVAIKKRVHRQNRSVQAFLSWRFQQIAASFPATPLPKTLLLWAKLYSSPHIVNDLYLWDKSGNTFPLARWTPGLLTPAGMLPVQAWQSSGQYIWLPLEGPP